MNVPTFSVVVIARNEARTLPILARSLQPFLSAGGELLVVDTGSDDGTVRAAREAGARVETAGARFHSVLTAEEAADITSRFSRGKEGPLVEAGQVLFDFGRARQFAGALASNDFVWHIDASDEIVSADFEFLDRAVRRGDATSVEYFLRLGSAHFRIARFFDRRFYSWRGRVHEAPYQTDALVTGLTVSCDESQLSLCHTRNEKARNYLAGLALDVIDDPSTPRWTHYLGRELTYARLYKSAIAVLRGHARATHAWVAERGESLCLIGTCLEALGRPEAAALSYFRASRIDPSRRQPLLKLAALYQNRSDFQSSVAFAAAARMVPRTSPYIDAEENHASDPHAILYWGLFWLGRREEAKAHWEICCRMEPGHEKFREDGRLFRT